MSRSINELPADLYDAFKVIQEAKLNPRVVNDTSTRFASICPFHAAKGFAMWGDLDGIQGCSCKACGTLDPDTAIATARMIGLPEAPADNAHETAQEAISATLTPEVPESLPEEKEPEIAPPDAPAVNDKDVRPTAPPPAPASPVRKERPAATTLDRQAVGVHYDDFINALDRHGCKPRKRGKGHTAQCPAHDDKNPSLDIDPKSDGGVLAVCRSAGCSFDQILDALGLKGVGYEKPEKTPYPTRKGIRVHAPAYLDGDDLIIPLVDIKGVKRATQTIWPEKRILEKDGKPTDKMTKGKGQNEYFFQFGDRELSDTLLIATGYATSASLFESTGNPVTMSMADDTLPYTLELIHKENADKELIVCCDYDARNKKKILDAVINCNALLCYPVIPGNEKADFNDLMLHSGKESVCEIVGSAQKPEAFKQDQSDDEPVTPEPEPVKTKSDNSTFVEFKNGALFEPECIDWDWLGWIAKKKLHIIAGEPGTNKTTLTMAFAATESIAGRWPDGSYCSKAQNVVIWSSEDDFEDTLLPRFIANGGDRSRLYYIRGVNHKGNIRAFNPKKDLNLLTQQIEKIGNVGMVIIDSIADLSRGDSNSNSDTRNSLQPLVDAANRYNFAAIGVAHFNKGTENSNPLNRIVGSVAFGGMARIVFASAVDADEPISQRLLVRVKSNIGKNHDGFRYAVRIDSLPNYPHIQAAHIEWMQELQGTAKDLLGFDPYKDEEKSNADAVEKAKDFLIKTLSTVDMMRQDEILRLAKENGFRERSLREAKKEAKILSVKGEVCWYWKLPHAEESVG